MSGEDIVRQLVSSSKCDACGQTYEDDGITIIGRVEETWLLQLNCKACHSQTLLAVTVDQDDVFSSAENDSESLSDLMAHEVDKFEKYVITNDDVLDMRNFLNGFDGKVNQLFD